MLIFFNEASNRKVKGLIIFDYDSHMKYRETVYNSVILVSTPLLIQYEGAQTCPVRVRFSPHLSCLSFSKPSVPSYFIGNGVDNGITELGSFTVGGRHVVLPTGMVWLNYPS